MVHEAELKRENDVRPLTIQGKTQASFSSERKNNN